MVGECSSLVVVWEMRLLRWDTLNLTGVALNNTPNIGINQTDFIQSLDLVGSVRDCYGSILISVLDYNVHI